MSRRLLVVDDNGANARLVQAIFTPEGFEVQIASDGESGLERIRVDRPDVVLLDLRLPRMDGMAVLEQARSACPTIPIVMTTAHGDVRSAVRATQLGAADYLMKPTDPDEMIRVVKRALEASALRKEVEQLRHQLGGGGSLASQMGPSQAVAHVAAQVERVATTDFSVLILGETGTGKELVAQALHRQSERRAGPLLAVDCGAIPDSLLESELFGHERGAFTGAERRREGRFQLAEGGTLFLDEVGNLPLPMQAKLLRVLESRQLQAVGAAKSSTINLRFVAATNDDLQMQVARGQFRADLYFRLAQYTISLPPLRSRIGDIPHLARRFLAEVGIELRRPVQGIDPEAIVVLERHDWPGNVRELRNVLRRAVLESENLVVRRVDVERFLVSSSRDASASSSGVSPITSSSTARLGPSPNGVSPEEAIPARTTEAGPTLREAAENAARQAEHQLICETLRRTGGNKSQAARALSTDYKTLHTKINLLGIRAGDFSR